MVSPSFEGRSIVLVNRVHPPDAGATGRLVADLAERLSAVGWSVSVLACGGPGVEDRPGYTLRRAGGRAGRGVGDSAAQLAALARGIAALPPVDVLVTMTDPPLLPLVAGIARRRARVLVHWSMDLYPELLPVVGARLPAPGLNLLRRCRDAALSRHDAIVALGPCMEQRLRRSAHGPLPPIVRQPPWADPVIRPDPPDAAPVRARLLTATGARRLAIYAGTLGRAHPVEPLVGAVHRAAERRRTDPTVPGFVFVGAGEGMAMLRRRLGTGLPGVAWLPPQPSAALSATLAAADVHLAMLDPRAEGLMVPSKVVGALAAGRPVAFAGPPGGTMADFVRRAGRVVDPADPDALLSAATDLANVSGADRARLRQAARQAIRGLDADAAAEQWLALTHRLLAAAERRGRFQAPPAADPAEPALGMAGSMTDTTSHG